MHGSRRYRDSAAGCLLAAQEASQPHYRKLHLSMAISWLSLARQYEAIERLFQGTGEAALIKGAHYPNGKLVDCAAQSTSRQEQSRADSRSLMTFAREPGGDLWAGGASVQL
jgi:hypothetical protein